jgi:hypothetical protein
VDQTRVQSGFDAEVMLGERYLQYLLLLAVDVGLIPVEFTFEQPGQPQNGLFHARLVVPDDLDRTYAPDPAAPLPEPGRSDAFSVEILFGHPLGADLKVKVLAHTTRAEDNFDLVLTVELFVKIGLQKTADSSGVGLAAASISIELVEVIGPAPDLLARFKPTVDRTLDLTGVGSGGRLQDIALRKFAADGESPAALGVYLNLRLRSGPQADTFLLARGDVSLAKNLLPADADMVFATRADFYGSMAADAKFRRAVPSGSGFSFPLKFKHRNGTLISVIVEPLAENRPAGSGPNEPLVFKNQLRTRIKAEVEVDNWFDPDMTLIIDISAGLDADGVMTWNSSSTVHDSSLIHDILLAGIAAAFIPLTGPLGALVILTGLEIGKQIAEALLSDYYLDDRVEKRLDATLLDIAPNRLTIVRRRWDPLYETQHQIGLRAGGTLITDQGLAFWGRAVLTRATRPVSDVVIRDSVRDIDEAPSALVYRVQDIASVREQLSALTPAQDRRTWIEPDPINDPTSVLVTVEEALGRINDSRLLGAHPYLVKGVEMDGSTIKNLLVISERESNEQKNRLLDEKTVAVSATITANQEAAVRAQVLADFAASGVIPTQQEIDAAVTSALQVLIDADVAAYVDGALTADLDAALLPLLRLQMAPTHFGELQSKGVLTIKDFDLIHLTASNRFYYRDHFDGRVEKTLAQRQADNLPHRPRYRSTANGPQFI